MLLDEVLYPYDDAVPLLSLVEIMVLFTLEEITFKRQSSSINYTYYRAAIEVESGVWHLIGQCQSGHAFFDSRNREPACIS